MTDALAAAFKSSMSGNADPEALTFVFCLECGERVRHLLEDPAVVRCLDTLACFVRGQVDRSVLDSAASEAAALANRHQGSHSIDGVGHAAVSASFAVANALAGRAIQTADYAAYAVVYAGGGYGAVSNRESFLPEHSWQLAKLEELSSSLSTKDGAA